MGLTMVAPNFNYFVVKKMSCENNVEGEVFKIVWII